MPDAADLPTPRADALVPVPDLAGTPAEDAVGRIFGDVYGALADASTGLIRYLDLDVHGADRHVLVPIGHVRVARTDEPAPNVRLRAATAADLRAIPPYEPHAPPDEPALLAAHGRLFSGEKYYAHPAFDHAGLYAGDRSIVHEPGAAVPAGATLAPLSSLSRYEVAEGEPDVRGWKVLAAEGTNTGTVEDLLVEPAALRARYLLVRRRSGTPVLLPVGYAELDRDERAIWTPALRADDLAALPAVTGPVGRAQEEAVRAALEQRLDGPRRYLRADFRDRTSEADRAARHAAPGTRPRGGPQMSDE